MLRIWCKTLPVANTACGVAVIIVCAIVLTATTCSAGVITPYGGQAGVVAQYDFQNNVTDYRTGDSVALSHEHFGVTASAGGSGDYEISEFAVSNSFSLSTKASIEGEFSAGYLGQGASLSLEGFSEAHFLVEFGPSYPWIDGYGLGIMTTIFEWSVIGSVAPGDTVYVSLFNGVRTASGHVVFDSQGALIGYGQNLVFNNTGSEALPIAFSYRYESALWDGGIGQIMKSTAAYNFAINHFAGSSGKTWVGFSDPGIYNQIPPSLTTVPEPSSVSLWLCSIGALAFLTQRRRGVQNVA